MNATQDHTEFFAGLAPGAWFSMNGEHFSGHGTRLYGPHGCFRLIRVLSGYMAGGHGQIMADIADARSGQRFSAYLSKWNTCPVVDRPVIRCAHCESDNSGGFNGWSGRTEGSICRCWDGNPEYAYLGIKPVP